MAAFDIGDRALARLDAIEKIADVKIELLGGRSWFFHGLYPRLRFHILTNRPAGRVPLKNRNGIGRIDLHVWDYFEAGARNCQASFRAEELETGAGTPSRARFAIGIKAGKARILKKSVLGIGCLAQTLQREACSRRRNSLRPSSLHDPLNDVDFVGAKIGHLATRIVPKPAKVINSAHVVIGAFRRWAKPHLVIEIVRRCGIGR